MRGDPHARQHVADRQHDEVGPVQRAAPCQENRKSEQRERDDGDDQIRETIDRLVFDGDAIVASLG
jgi:hypothetical protein